MNSDEIRIVEFNPRHLQYIDIQQDQSIGAEILEYGDEYTDLLMMGEAYTAYDDCGRIVVIAGVFPFTDTIGRAWALVSKDLKPTTLRVTREIFRFLCESKYGRVETPVRRDFQNAHRWCKLLGFTNETPNTGMKYYGFEGETYDLYAIYPQELTNGKTKPFQKTKEARHQRSR